MIGTMPNAHKIALSRQEEILRLAEGIRARFDPSKIDEVAIAYDITLIRSRGSDVNAAGFAYTWTEHDPIFIDSLSHPGQPLRVWGEKEKSTKRAIAINSNSELPEREIFWHEFYHLFYSPESVDRAEEFKHSFSVSVLHSKEERRADEFAAAVLIPSIEFIDSIEGIADRYNTSNRLAEIAVKFYSSFNNSMRSLTTALAVGKLPAPLP
jgi:hypothetical protein